VNTTTAQKILATNHQFYQTFAVQFAATRQRLQPGVRRLLDESCFGANILDLGCGNSELAHALYKSGFNGLYTGLDFSQALLDCATRDLPAVVTTNCEQNAKGSMQACFLLQDVTQTDWTLTLPRQNFDTILAFAVMHHLPGVPARLAFLGNIRSRLATGGLFIHSNWQFLNSDRLKARIQPWEKIGLHPADVDQGDYLLDWRSGGSGLRYAHHFTHAELLEAAAQTGFHVLESFVSDGETGNLGLYQIWQAH